MKQVICSNCNKIFNQKYFNKNAKNHFCCKKCESEFRKGKLTRPKKQNEIILNKNYAIIKINNNLYGKFDCLIDIEDIDKIKDLFWNIRMDKRHPNCLPYVESRKNKKRIHLHRFIMNCPDNMVVDHINGNNLDNRKENLRICTQQHNILNNHFAKNISYINRDKKYVVYFRINGKVKNICYTRDIKEAEYYARIGRNLINENKISTLLSMPCKFISKNKKVFET